MLEDFSDHIVLAGFDKGDDFHGAAALGAAQGVDLIDALDEDGPAAADGFGRAGNRRGRVGRRLPRCVG